MEISRRIVAIAEHDLDDRLLFKEAIDECEHDLQIDFLDNGPDLLDYLYRRGKYAQSASRPNLVLMTLDLPGKSGFEIIAEIKADFELKRIPFIVITDTLFEKDLGRCYELGANTVVTKPSDYHQLVKIMKSLCEFWFKIARS